MTTTAEAHLAWNASLFDRLFRRWQELTKLSPERFAADAGCSRSSLHRLRGDPSKWPSVHLAYRIALILRTTGEELGDAELAAVTIDDFVQDE